MVGGVERIRRCVRAVSIAMSAFAFAACGSGAPSATTVSLAQAEAVRDGCVADGLVLLRELSDRLAPLARAASPEEREATAISLGCVKEGDRYLCEPLGVWLSLFGDVLTVEDTDPLRGVAGELRLRNDPARGLVFTGHLHIASESGCSALLELDELVALEAFGMPDGSLGLFFSAGAVDVTVAAPDDALFATGTAAFTGRSALVALNFDGRRLLDELALD